MIVETIADVRRCTGGARKPVALVPTMGALHAGHGALIDCARAECGFVVVSVFVNPIQFDCEDDYERYPRTLATDARFCDERGVDVIFAPDAREMYPLPLRTSVNVAVLSDHLCGRYRPGHFQGVATVVAKLFHIVQPEVAYFGEKDAQQLAIIERMAADLNMAIAIRRVPTVRESDGLALSSRNHRLSAEERRAAPVLYRALCAARSRTATAAEAKRAALEIIAQQPLVKVEYLEVVDEDMTPVEEIHGPVRIAVAAWLGATRLIDNVSA